MIQKIFTSSTLLQIYEQTMKERSKILGAKEEEGGGSPTMKSPGLSSEMMKNIQSPG
jgi:hypothetical protein